MLFWVYTIYHDLQNGTYCDVGLDVCISFLKSGLQASFCQLCACTCMCIYHRLDAFDGHSGLKALLAGGPSIVSYEHRASGYVIGVKLSRRLPLAV